MHAALSTQRSRWLATFVTSLLAISACSEAGPPGVRAPDRLVLIVADTLRRDAISPYGAEIETPNLQALADRGHLFTNAFSSFHQTTMSMSALFTGRTPSLETGDAARPLPWNGRTWCGMARYSSGEADACIPHRLETIAEDMQEAGYETLAVVSNRLLYAPLGYEQGFDHWVEIGETKKAGTPWTRRQQTLLHRGEKVNEALRSLLAGRDGDRFFLYVHYLDAHDYGRRPGLDDYADGVRAVDRMVGELFEMLEEEGLLAGTTVVFTADHGEHLGAPHPVEPLPRHNGNPSFDSLLKVPLLVAPRSTRDPAAFIRSQDIRGMLREMVALPARHTTDLQPNELFVTEAEYRTYRNGRFKSMTRRSTGEMMLFDLEEDPGETTNLVGARPRAEKMHARRLWELTGALRSERARSSELSQDDAERLRALGYLE